MTITVTLPWPDKALQSNSKAHHMVKYRANTKARYAAFYAGKEAKLPCWPDATILIEYYPPSFRGDIHNVPSSLKAQIDGIADAMGCDDKGFVVDYPTVWAGKVKGGKVVYRISEARK